MSALGVALRDGAQVKRSGEDGVGRLRRGATQIDRDSGFLIRCVAAGEGGYLGAPGSDNLSAVQDLRIRPVSQALKVEFYCEQGLLPANTSPGISSSSVVGKVGS